MLVTSRKSSIALAATIAALGAATLSSAKDSLVTKRHSKRFIDENGNYNVTFLHTNDVHAHLDEWRAGRGTDCTEGNECISGYARIKSKVEEIRASTQDVIVLNAGDEFQGTLFFTFYGGEKIALAVNDVGYDAMTLGNHEFDKGLDELAAFIGNLTFPVVVSNLKTNHTGMTALDIKPYTILEPHRIGLIGALTPSTKGTSSGAGPGTDISDPVPAVQAAIDELISQNVTRIVALTHLGYDNDIALAQKTKGLDLIIGGHSHSLLGSMEGAKGDYPTIAENLDGEEVFVVTAYRWGEYLGSMNVAWDAEGKIVSYEGEPIRLGNTTAQDPSLDAQVAEWRAPFDEFSKTVVGETSVDLEQSTCQHSECTLGNLITDAMYDYRVSAGGQVDAALINAGGIRASIGAGPVTQGDVLTSFPFLNALVDLTWTGEYIWDIFEGIASDYSELSDHEVTSFVQVSKQVKFAWNPSQPAGQRLISFEINGEPLEASKNYTIVTVDFLATGGDYFWEPRSDFVALSTLDEVLVLYLNKSSPVTASIEGRITNSTETAQQIPGSGNGGESDGGSGASMGALVSGFLTGVVAIGTAAFALF